MKLLYYPDKVSILELTQKFALFLDVNKLIFVCSLKFWNCLNECGTIYTFMVVLGRFHAINERFSNYNWYLFIREFLLELFATIKFMKLYKKSKTISQVVS